MKLLFTFCSQIDYILFMLLVYISGTHRQTIITENITWPNGIALDVPEQRIYWCDAKWNRIESANVDGTDRKILISNEYLGHPFGLTILGDYFYWTDWDEVSFVYILFFAQNFLFTFKLCV